MTPEVMKPKATLRPFQDFNPVSLLVAKGKQARLKRVQFEV